MVFCYSNPRKLIHTPDHILAQISAQNESYKGRLDPRSSSQKYLTCNVALSHLTWASHKKAQSAQWQEERQLPRPCRQTGKVELWAGGGGVVGGPRWGNHIINN